MGINSFYAGYEILHYSILSAMHLFLVICKMLSWTLICKKTKQRLHWNLGWISCNTNENEAAELVRFKLSIQKNICVNFEKSRF